MLHNIQMNVKGVVDFHSETASVGHLGFAIVTRNSYVIFVKLDRYIFCTVGRFETMHG